MNLVEFALRVAGKKDFKIDYRVSNTYIIHIFWKYGWMMLRGRAISLLYKNIANDVFVGKRVNLIEKRYLKIGSKSKIHDYSKIDALSIDGVKIGESCVLGRNTTIECTGSLDQLGKGLYIGDRTTFGNDCFFGAAGGIKIGNDVVAGQYIRFHSENHKYSDLTELIKDQGVTHKGIKIGNNCWIGSGVVFLDGAQLSDGCVVAANAVVAEIFPENSLVGGVPAKIIKFRGQSNE